MPGFKNRRQWNIAERDGSVRLGNFRKVPSQTSVAGWWVDLTMAAGNPKPNYYATEPLVAAALSGMNGIFHGDDVAPARKFLTRIGMISPTAGLVGAYKLLDFLLYYPFIDGDATEEQAMDNALTLPRYADGDGVRAMMVAVTPTTGGGQFTYNYTDDQGVDRTSPNIFCSVAAANIASIVTSEPATAAGGALWLPMDTASKGIRKINSVTYSVPNGGLTALVLVRQIADHAIHEVSVPSETQWPQEKFAPPEVKDDAYLGLIMNCAATVAAGLLTGDINTTFE